MLSHRDASWGALCAHLGAGRRDGNLQLAIEELGGTGWLWPFRCGLLSGTFFSPGEAWCEWLAPQLELPEPSAVDPDLLPLLTEWTFAGLQEVLGPELHVDLPTIVDRPWQWDPTFTDTRSGASLKLVVSGSGLDRLLTLTAPWEESPCGPPICVPIPLAVGWCVLAASELKKLRVGSGVGLIGAAPEAGHSALLFLDTAVAVITCTPDQRWVVEEQVKAPVVEIPELSSLEALPLTVVAEVGRVTLPLATLCQLKAGYVIEEGVSFDHEVHLTVQGSRIASGTLLVMGDRYVVQIERLAEGWGASDDEPEAFFEEQEASSSDLTDEVLIEEEPSALNFSEMSPSEDAKAPEAVENSPLDNSEDEPFTSPPVKNPGRSLARPQQTAQKCGEKSKARAFKGAHSTLKPASEKTKIARMNALLTKALNRVAQIELIMQGLSES